MRRLALHAVSQAGPSPWARLWAFARLERRELVLLFLLASGLGLLSLAVPVTAQAVIRTVAIGSLRQPLLVLGSLLTLGLLFAVLLEIAQMVAVESVSRRLFLRVVDDFAERMGRLSRAEVATAMATDRIHRFFDVVTVEKAVAAWLFDGLAAALRIAVGLALLAVYHPWLMALDLALIAGLAVALLVLGHGALGAAIDESKRKYALAGWLEQLAEDRPVLGERTLSGLAVATRTQGLARDWLDARGRHFRALMRQVGGVLLLQVAVSVGVLVLGGFLVLGGELDLGQLVAAELVTAATVSAMGKLGKLLGKGYDLLAAVDKLGSVTDLPTREEFDRPEPPEAPPLVGDAGLMPADPARPLRAVGVTLVAALVLVAVVLRFTPWQQTAPAEGKVIAFSPVDREQRVDAPIKGRVVEWFVVEGQRVRKGDPICRLADLDPRYVERLQTKLRAAKDAHKAALSRVDAARDKFAAWRKVKDKAVRAAELEVDMAGQKVLAVKQKVRAAVESERVATLDVKRRRRMLAEGLESRRGLELAELSDTKAKAKVRERRAERAETRALVTAKKAGALKTEAEMIAKIATARSDLRKAEADAAKARSEVARYEVDLARQQQGTVRAPRDGVVTHLSGNQAGGVVKAGDPLAVVVPTDGSRAVELWIDGRDAPLVAPGRLARVQLEGWPALQLSGWPALASGTFEARVSFIAPVSRSDGRFRVVLQQVPGGAPWPPTARLQQGLQARGWVFLDEVSLGYELWRLFNGFPPQAPEPEGSEGGKAGKGGKGSKGAKASKDDHFSASSATGRRVVGAA